MAKGERVKPAPVQDTIILTLSQDEAQDLRNLLYHAATPVRHPLSYTEVRNALEQAGVRATDLL